MSTPRLTPLRMFERNRNADRMDMTRLEQKLLDLEKDIVQAKKVAEKSPTLQPSAQPSENAKLDLAANLIGDECLDDIELLDEYDNSVALMDNLDF